MMFVLGIPGGVEMMFLFFFFGLPFLIVLAALIDILKNEFEPQQNKLIWVLVTLLIPVIGSILYFAIGRSQRANKT